MTKPLRPVRPTVERHIKLDGAIDSKVVHLLTIEQRSLNSLIHDLLKKWIECKEREAS